MDTPSTTAADIQIHEHRSNRNGPAVCQVDARPALDAHLCPGCIDQLCSHLRQVRWLEQQLTVTLTRQARVGHRVGPRPTERAMPYHHGASVDLESLRDGLQAWCRTIATQRGITVDSPHTPTGYAAWLSRWAGEAAQHPEAGELYDDVAALTRAAQRTIDLAPELRFVGKCDGNQAQVAPTVPAGCGEDLYVGPNSREAVCTTDDCNATYPIEARRAWMLEQTVDRLFTAAEMSRILPQVAGITVDRKRINQWASRGQITKYLPHAREDRRTPRFRVGEIIDMARSAVSGPATGAA